MATKKRILIVDDDPEILVQMRWALDQEFDLTLAQTPREAADALRDEAPPEVALVDLHLPPDTTGIDGGLAVIRRLKRSSGATRVLAFTAQVNEESHRLCRSAGAEMLLGKPVQRAELLEILREENPGSRRSRT